MTQKEFWKIVNETGIVANDYESLLNLLSILYGDSAKCTRIEAQFEISHLDKKRHEELADIYERRSKRIFDKLDERGYYDSTI